MRIVLDTNVLVSGLINPNGIPAVILGLFLNGKIKLAYDNRILSEYSDVLHRKKFGFKSEWIEPIVDYIQNEGEFIVAEPTHEYFIDEEDKKFYEVAKTCKAEFIVTGNISHYPKDKIMKTPKQFFDIYISKSKNKK
jgi:putative PIN family toxin of toxin-antitoxin system